MTPQEEKILTLIEELSPGFKNLGILDSPQWIEEGAEHYAELLFGEN